MNTKTATDKVITSMVSGDGLHIDIINGELEEADSLEAKIKVIRESVEYLVAEEIEAIGEESEYRDLNLAEVEWNKVLTAFQQRG